MTLTRLPKAIWTAPRIFAFIFILLVVQSCHEETESPLAILDIQLEGIELSEPFSQNVTEYAAAVPFDTTSIHLSIEMRGATDQTVVVVLNGQLQNTDIMQIEPGENRIEIITYHGNAIKKTYTITLIRAKSAYLTNISILPSNATMEAVSLEDFGKFDNSVSFNVDRAISEITLQLEKEDSLSTTQILYRGKNVEDNRIQLSLGENRCTVTVFSADNRSKKTYEIVIVRMFKRDASIHDLAFSSGELTPAFSADIHQYELFVTSPEAPLTFQSVIDEMATQKYFYNNTQIQQEETIKTSSLPQNLEIEVLADDSLTTIKYSINVYHQSWEFVGRGPFDPRDGAGVVEFNGKLWLLGGWEQGPTVSEVWSSSNGEDWEFVTDAPWPGRHCAGFVVFKNRMWVISGDGLLDVWSSVDGVNWIKELDSAPWGRRYAPYVVAFDDKLWLMGGANFYPADEYGLPSGPLNDVWNSVDGINWTKVGTAPWSPRGLIHGHVVFKNKLWLVGGGSKDNAMGWGYNDVWNTRDGINWTLVTDNAPWAGRYHFSVETFDDKIWLTDGSIGAQNNLSNEVWFSDDGINWQQIKHTPWSPTHATSLISFQSSLYIISGYITNNIWKFRLTK